MSQPLPAGKKPSSPRGRPGAVRERGTGRAALLLAARAEFDEVGFEGTDTNRIARRAGYAPQTFYRHFDDKTAVFVEIYRRWLEEEWNDLGKAHGQGAEKSASILLRHHRAHREFRRSLRRLTISNPTVRRARADSRKAQLERLGAQSTAEKHGANIALLLCIERIADAAADGELSDLGLTHAAQRLLLADVIRRLSAD